MFPVYKANITGAGGGEFGLRTGVRKFSIMDLGLTNFFFAKTRVVPKKHATNMDLEIDSFGL